MWQYRRPRNPPPTHQVPPAEEKLRIKGLPPGATLADVHNHFKHFGSIDYLALDPKYPGQAYVTFSPVPNSSIWQPHVFQTQDGRSHQIVLEPMSRFGTVPSPLDRTRNFPARMTLQLQNLQIGVLTGPSDVTVMNRIDGKAGSSSLSIDINIKSLELIIKFPLLRGSRHHQTIVKFGHILGVHNSADKALTLELRYPPKYLANPEAAPTIAGDVLSWKMTEALRRVTDLDRYPVKRQEAIVSLFKDDVYIDTGRWLTWHLTFDDQAGHLPGLMIEILNAHNVPITSGALPHLTHIRGPVSPVWTEFDKDKHLQLRRTNAPTNLQALRQHFPVLDFETRYQLEVCFSKALLWEGRITKNFLERLAASSRAVDLLENLVASDRRLRDPMKLFEIPELQATPRRRRMIPKTCVLMHSVTITPTTMYVQPIQVEVSNRVIRHYNDLADRFLRVRFSDELYWGRLQSQRDDRDVEVYNRVRRALVNGIRVGGREYTFLACGNSQFRENGAYFFSPTKDVNVIKIRQWMGLFSHIREIPKYVARIGQCFSTTKAVTSIGNQPDIVKIPDIERNGHNFTDGVGKMSPFLAQMIATELHLGEVPSVFQFRMGGCKGILAVDPNLTGSRAVHIRPSQQKFITEYNQLEIIRVSHFATAYLNRQIILVLSALGIADDVFVRKIQTQLEQINRAIEDDETALTMLQHSVDFNQITLTLSAMIRGGLRRDPFVDSMLQLWRAWVIKFLKEKVNLFIGDGAFVFGCVDETATLRMDKGQLPEIFIQVPDRQAARGYRVVQGTCIIARNPSLYPGDIRVVNAVDCTKLHHLKNVVVIPQHGERDLANMCSGGDLDGDDFLVIWDPELIPNERHHEPMDYTGPKPIMSHGPVTQSDIIQFFCDYMKNDSLGTIAVAHRAWADKLDNGVKDSKCIRLAHLHSMAVDYCKTGVPAVMSSQDRVQVYPHWHGKPRHISYTSEKVLGKLFDEVERVEFKPSYECKFDGHILSAYGTADQLDSELLQKAKTIKAEYDLDIRRLMASFGIETEFEVCSAFVMAHNKEIKDYKFAEEMGRLMSSIKQHYRDICTEALGIQQYVTEKDLEKLGPFVAAAYCITARETEAFVQRGSPDSEEYNPFEQVEEEFYGPAIKQTPLISFPWIFQDELIAIAYMAESDDEISLLEALLASKRAAKHRTLIAAGATRFDHVGSHANTDDKTAIPLPVKTHSPDDAASMLSRLTLKTTTDNIERPLDEEDMSHKPGDVDAVDTSSGSSHGGNDNTRPPTPDSSVSSELPVVCGEDDDEYKMSAGHRLASLLGE